MMDDERQGDDDAAPSAGVFENLPTARPGTRSPRRKSSETAAGDDAPAETELSAEQPARAEPGSPRSRRPDPVADAEAVAAATAPDPSSEFGDEADQADQPGEQPRRGGLEEIAWAGVAAAADAATIGVRLAGRAIERLRDGVDRR